MSEVVLGLPSLPKLPWLSFVFTYKGLTPYLFSCLNIWKLKVLQITSWWFWCHLHSLQSIQVQNRSKNLPALLESYTWSYNLGRFLGYAALSRYRSINTNHQSVALQTSLYFSHSNPLNCPQLSYSQFTAQDIVERCQDKSLLDCWLCQRRRKLTPSERLYFFISKQKVTNNWTVMANLVNNSGDYPNGMKLSSCFKLGF